MNEKMPIYGDMYFDTSYQVDDIKIAILFYLNNKAKIYSNGGSPSVIEEHLLNKAIEDKKLIGYDYEFTYYANPYFSDAAKKKINIALHELLMDKKLYYDFFDNSFKLWHGF